MKYRSFNEELLIATALLINVFNDIIIDRRKHGLNRDFSKTISLKDYAQQEIEIPCILGERSSILKSLENEGGRYKLPLIILSNKSIKTDTLRMVDLHSDVFYQQDSQFSKLDPSDPLYKPQQIGKRRAQPINMEFDMTIITKYKEDMDQIISNWMVFFKPDIYVKWWNPRRDTEEINSQILWNHNLNYELPIEYNPTNVFTYKSTTSFTFKTWLFPGINSEEHKIDPSMEKIIRKFRIFPNRGLWWSDDEIELGEKDANYNDETYMFGNIYKNEEFDDDDPLREYDSDNLYTFEAIKQKQESPFAFFGINPGDKFYNDGSDIDGLNEGKYVVNNILKNNDIRLDKTLSDTYTNYEKDLINIWSNYQTYLLLGPIKDSSGTAFIKNVYFKGGFPEEAAHADPPSGDLLYRRFCRVYTQNEGTDNEKIVSSEFGDSFINNMFMSLNYNIDTKNLTLSSSIDDNNYIANAIAVFNSEKGIYHNFSIKSTTKVPSQEIKINIERECDSNFDLIEESSKDQTKNVMLLNKLINGKSVEFEFQLPDFKRRSLKLINLLSVYKKSINLNEIRPGEFEIIFNDSKVGAILKEKDLYDVQFMAFSLSYQTFLKGFMYQVLINKYIYLVIKINERTPDDAEIYDFGVISPFKFTENHAPIFEITIPESKMLLGLAIDMEI